MKRPCTEENYEVECSQCDNGSPTVGKSKLCGVCYFGEAQGFDPERWPEITACDASGCVHKHCELNQDWLTGKGVCSMCHHEWTVVVPVEKGKDFIHNLECPSCGHMTGEFQKGGE